MRQYIIIKWKWKSVYTSFCFELWWIKQLIIFKLNNALYQRCISCKLHQFICFCILSISQQYAFTTLGLEVLSLVHRNYGPSFGTKKSQVRYIRLMPVKCFERSGPNHWFMRNYIMYVCMYKAQFTTSSQREGGIFVAWIRQVYISFNDLFFLSATPLCRGVYGTECCIWMPTDAQSYWNSLLTYTPPLL